MANLFQPTYRASNLAAPSIPGADIGAFGKAVADIKLRNLQQDRLDSINRRAEEDAAFKRADRADLEASRDFLKGYDYDPKADPNLLNAEAASALKGDVARRVNTLLLDKGIIDRQGKPVEGAKYTPDIISEIDSINARTTEALRKVPVTKETVFKDAFGKAIQSTGNYDLANKFAESVSSQYRGRKDFVDAEKERVDTANKAIESKQKLLVEQAKLDSRLGKKSDSDKGNYAQNWDVLQSEDYDVSIIDSLGIGDAGKVKNIINKGRDSKLEPWAVDKAIRNSIDRGGLGDKLYLSEKSILDLAKSYGSGKTGASSIPILERVKERSFQDIMKDEGDLAFDNRLRGGSTPSNISRNTTTPSYRSGKSSTGGNAFDALINNLNGGRTTNQSTVAPEQRSTVIPNTQEISPTEDTLRELDIKNRANNVPSSPTPSSDNGISYRERLEAASRAAGGFTPRERVQWTIDNPHPDSVPLSSLGGDTSKLINFLYENRNVPIRELLFR